MSSSPPPDDRLIDVVYWAISQQLGDAVPTSMQIVAAAIAAIEAVKQDAQEQAADAVEQ